MGQLSEIDDDIRNQEIVLLKLFTSYNVERVSFLEKHKNIEDINWIKNMKKSDDKNIVKCFKEKEEKISKIRDQILDSIKLTGLPLDKFRDIISTIRQGQRDEIKAKKEMIMILRANRSCGDNVYIIVIKNIPVCKHCFT